MAIETLDDIIEDLADKIGVYGACSGCVEEAYCEENRCRVCFTSGLKSRLTLALDLEAKIATMERILRESQIMDKTVAILSRTNRALLPVGAALMEQNIPHYYVGKSGFFAQPEIKSVLAYLGCVLYPADWLVAGAIRAPFFPSKFLPKTKILAELKRFKEEHENGSYWAVLVHEPHELVDNKNLQALHDFTTFVHQLSRYKSLPADEALKSVISALRAVEYYSVEEDHSGDNDPVGNLVELTKLAVKHSTIKEFLDYTRRASAASKSKKGVALSTIHSAKGLEFSTVFMVQCSEGILPHSKSTDLDEERAIYFVGCSRPEHRLVISYTGNPSPFLKKESTCAQ